MKRTKLYKILPLLICLLAGTVSSSCKKYDTGPPADPYSSNTFYVSFYDNGTKKEFRQTIDNVLNDARSTATFDVFEEISTFSRTTSPVNEGFTIEFARIFKSNPYQYQTDSLFTFQKYTNFGQVSANQATAIIYYTDENGFTWTTQNTGNAQIGSNVFINYSFAEGGIGFRYTVKGTFSCLLYNTSSPTEYKNITNGNFTAKFGFGN